MNKITNSEIQKYHVQSVTGNRLTGTVEQNKRVFDNFPQFVADRINEIIDELTGTGGAGSISTTGGTLQSVLDSYLASINDRYTKDATNTLVTAETKDLVKSVAVDINTGVITVTKKDGTATTIDTAIEKIPATFSLENDDATGKASLVVTNQDGSVTKTDVSNLLNHYTFENTGLINFTAVKSSDGYHITAVVNDASVGMAQLNAEVTDYINGVKAAVSLSESNAKTSETNAKTSETNASASASKAQSYAVGGTGTRTGEDSDNAKYYAEQASNSAYSAESSANSATSSATSAATSAASAEKAYQDVKDIAALGDIAEIISRLDGKGKTYTFTDDTATDSDGNAQAVTVTKVNGHTVKADVPDDAKFTDTVTKVVTEYGNVDETVALSKGAIKNYVQDILGGGNYAVAMVKTYVDLLATSAGISTPIDYSGLKSLASLGTNSDDDNNCFNVKSIAAFLEILCEQIDTNTSSISSKADSATTLSGYGITDAYTKSETDTALAKKQDKLTFDSEPTKDSTNAITSGGVYKALNGEITVTTQNDNLLDPNDTDNQVAKKIFYTESSSTKFISLSGDTAIYFPIKKWGAGTYTFPVDYEQYGGSAAYRIALFDSSKTYIKTITGTVKDTTDKAAHIMSISVTDSDLSTGYYIGLSIRTTQIGTSAMVVKDIDYPSSYVSYGTTTKTYKTQNVDNELVGKSAYFLGDSICAATSVGSSSSLYKKGWAGWVGEKNSMNWVNLGKDGATVSTVSTNTVISQMSSVKSDADYIIVEGGCNDFDQMHGSTDSAKMGALTAVWDDSSYTQSTFIGALEHVFYTLVTNHPNAKIGYIIPHIMGRMNWTQYETISYRIYYNKAIEVCKKWGIPYIDLWYESPLNPNLTVYYDASLGKDGNISDGSKAYVDGQHLTGHGYDLISPKIEAWMRTL